MFFPHQALCTRYPHESREVKLHSPAGVWGLGVETVGLSSTGVFVSKVMAGGVEGVQVGDQILAVNGQSTGRYQKIVSLTEGTALK